MVFAFQMHSQSGLRFGGGMSCSSLENARVHGQGSSRSCPWLNSLQQSKTSIQSVFCAFHALAHTR